MFLFGFPLWGTGSAIYTTKLCENLSSNKKNRVAIVAPGEHVVRNCDFYKVDVPLKAVFQSHPEYPKARKYSTLSPLEFSAIYLSFLKTTLKAVDDFKPDLIHVQHASFLAWVANYIKGLYGVDFIVTAHGTDIYHASLDARFQRLTYQALRGSSTIIAVSNHTRKWLYKLFGKDLAKKTRVISGGVDLKVYKKKNKNDISLIDKKYNLAGKKLVIYVGRVIKEKGLEYLLRAAKNINAEIFIIGGGADKQYMQESGKGIKNIHFLGYFGKGYIDELSLFYKRADVMVFPSIWDEPLGLVVLEAMACGTPVVASNKGGIPLVVKNNYNGYLIRAKSSKAISDATNKILNNKDIQRKFAKNARITVKEKFDWPIIVNKLYKVYQNSYAITQRLKAKRVILPQEDIKQEQRELQKKIGYF